VCEGDGRWREYEGGVEDWLTQSRRAAALAASNQRAAEKRGEVVPAPAVAPAAAPAPAAAAATPAGKASRKLSFKEQRELDELPKRLEALEAEQKNLGERLADPQAYQKEGSQLAGLQARYEAIEGELVILLERWELLSNG
jgi:ATP-binding cassette subfamily F protein uup